MAGSAFGAESGRGCMGMLYRAPHLRTGRAVSLEVVHVLSSGLDR